MEIDTTDERVLTRLISSVVKGRGVTVESELASQLAARSSSGTVIVVFCESFTAEARAESSDEAGEDA
jgi:hypothetical protein